MKFEETGFSAGLPVDAYGDDGFRVKGLFHKGSILMLPGGAYPWEVAALEEADAASLSRLTALAGQVELVIIGCGADIKPVPPAVRDALKQAGIKLEFMNTGAACRTYNVLLAEDRAVAGAFIAVP